MPAKSFKNTKFIYFLGLCCLLLSSLGVNAQNDSLKKVPVDKLPKLPIKSPANIRHVLVLPIIARSIETGWSFGAVTAGTFRIRKRDTTSRTSNAQALALYTTRHQFVMAINGSIYFPGERFILNEQVSYSSFPDNFWGLGKHAADSNKESYKYKQFYIYLHPQFLIGPKLFAGLVFEHQQVFDVAYTAGKLFDKENIPGRHGYHISGLGLSLTYDTRNNAFSPDRGMMAQVWFDHFASYLGSNYQYTNFVVDFRRFIRIVPGQVLALQAFGSFNTGETPLRSFAYLGGASNLRGYYAGRFRDKNAAILQGEYRVQVYRRIGVVGFAGIGNVGPELDYLDLRALKESWGGGLRFALNQKEKLNLRIDYGFARGKSSGLYLQIGEAF